MSIDEFMEFRNNFWMFMNMDIVENFEMFIE